VRRIMVTGHRPQKLFGFDMGDPRYKNIKEFFKIVLVESCCTEAISGMALGTDTIFSCAVLELKEEGFPISLTCAIPCRGFTSKWSKAAIDEYKRIMKKADTIQLVVDGVYSPAHMQTRNEWMVDRVAEDPLGFSIAIWDGGPGGTANCVDYLKRKGVKVMTVHPDEFQHMGRGKTDDRTISSLGRE
jgi:uncharacterized phage-like protein YoqJ